MRYFAMGVLLAAVASSALGQDSVWGAFDAGERQGVGVQSEDGAQLMFKCDKPGEGEVYAAVATQTSLVPPARAYVMRPVHVRVDDDPPYDDSWRFYTNTAVAINKAAERSLTRLLDDLGDATKLEVRLDPEPRNRTPITLRFDVTGAKDAIAAVYASCQDTLPTA